MQLINYIEVKTNNNTKIFRIYHFYKTGSNGAGVAGYGSTTTGAQSIGSPVIRVDLRLFPVTRGDKSTHCLLWRDKPRLLYDRRPGREADGIEVSQINP
jgi:hypothetical protein